MGDSTPAASSSLMRLPVASACGGKSQSVRWALALQWFLLSAVFVVVTAASSFNIITFLFSAQWRQLALFVALLVLLVLPVPDQNDLVRHALFPRVSAIPRLVELHGGRVGPRRFARRLVVVELVPVGRKSFFPPFGGSVILFTYGGGALRGAAPGCCRRSNTEEALTKHERRYTK